MGKGISYLNRSFSDYRDALVKFTKQYYPDLYNNISDASVGSWMIDINADIADNLSYHIDRAFQETNIDSANTMSSIMNIARTNGFKVPGPKGAVAEVRFTCYLPSSVNRDGTSTVYPNLNYAPIIKRGTVVSSGNQDFELMYDVDFSKEFNYYGIPDRTIEPIRESNDNIVQYRISKLAIVCSGRTRVFSQKLFASDITPFMEIILPGTDVMEVLSVITKDGTNYTSNPTMSEFLNEEENRKNNSKRFFEVNSLSDQFRWGQKITDGQAEKYQYKYRGDQEPVYSITKGEWKPIHNKFITEYTDKGFMKLIFGPGMEENIDTVSLDGASDFAKYQIMKMVKNNSLGYLPNEKTTLYVLYRVGGGKASNVPKGAIKKITQLNAEICGGNGTSFELSSAVKNSITVENTTPSVSGKDMPTPEELKHMIKYNSAAQERCVTLTDYKSRIMKMPPEYGMPYRIGVSEENNKVMVYLLGIDHNGNLSPEIPEISIINISEYLNHYRSINDFVEIKAGKIVNVSFNVTVYVDNKYTSEDIVGEIKDKIKSYMDVSRRDMGDDIFVGDIESEIGRIEGVYNVASVEVFNNTGEGYSPTPISQTVISPEKSGVAPAKVNLEDSDKILFCDGDSMLEVKYPDKDITVTVKHL